MYPRQSRDRTITVFATPRPLRIAVIIDAEVETAVSDFQQIDHYYTRLWGGRFNGIILSKNGELESCWKQVLRLIDADCIYSLTPLNKAMVDWVNKTCCPAIFRNGLSAERNLLEQLHIHGMIRETPVTLEAIPSRIAGRSNAIFTPKFYHICGNECDDHYKKFIALNFGLLPNDALARKAFTGIDTIQYDLSVDNTESIFNQIANDSFGTTVTPDILCASDALPHPGSGGNYAHNFTLVVGDDIADLALFRAIRMFKGSEFSRTCAWIPTGLLEQSSFINLLQVWITNAYWSSLGNKVQIMSTSRTTKDIDPLAITINNNPSLTARVVDVPCHEFGLPNQDDIFLPSIKKQRLLRLNHAPKAKAYQCGIVDGSGVIDLNAPDFLESSHSKQLMYDLEIPYLRNEPPNSLLVVIDQQIWRLPQRQGLADAILSGREIARVQREGLPSGVFNPQELFYFQMPTPESLFYYSFTADGINPHDVAGLKRRRFRDWRVSEEGQFLAALVDAFGTPSSCGYVLGHPFWGQMLRTIALGRNVESDVTLPSMTRALRLLLEQEDEMDMSDDTNIEAVALFLSRTVQASPYMQSGFTKSKMRKVFERLRGEDNKINSYWSNASWKDSGLDDELNDLVQAGILRMGIHHRCIACRTNQWIPVENISSTVRCTGCGTEQPLHAEPAWTYQVNALLAEAIRRRGVIAVVQAICNAEHGPSSKSFAVLPSLDVFDGHETHPFTDLDLVYFSDGEFVIGEVKASPSGFAKSDFEKLSEVAADLCPDRVVIAAPKGEWPSNVQTLFDECSSAQAPLGIRWQKRDLVW